MSYDLFFLVPKGEEPPGLDQLDDYFNARPNFTRVEDEFWYRNEATGVYFGFSHGDAGALEEEFGEPLEEVEDGLVAANLSFNLNYFRPPFFGLEAVIEVSALVRHFGFKVDDPQMDGMGRGEFSEEGFLRGWNFGNLLGYHAYLSPRPDGSPSKGRASVPQLPESELERIWGWNYRRRELQDRLGDDVYVALVRPLLQDGVLSSMIVWGDGISEVLPEVDQVVFYRDQLGPRKLFRRRKDTCLAPFAALKPVLPLATSVEWPVPNHYFSYREPPPEVVKLFKSQKPYEGELQILPWDQILSTEILNEAQEHLRETDDA